MPTITMSFDPDGSIEFTRNKNLDAFFGGAGRMRRVTDIAKLDDSSKFFIRWLLGPYAGKAHALEHHIDIFGSILDRRYGGSEIGDKTSVILFNSYEAAVQYEIDCLNAMRKAGVTFDETTGV